MTEITFEGEYFVPSRIEVASFDARAHLAAFLRQQHDLDVRVARAGDEVLDGSLVPLMKSLAGSSTARMTFSVSVASTASYLMLNSMRPLPFDSPSSPAAAVAAADSWSRDVSRSLPPAPGRPRYGDVRGDDDELAPTASS